MGLRQNGRIARRGGLYLEDETLLIRVADGDTEAFRLLYEDTQAQVYRFILSLVKNPQDAQEILQETYLKIWLSSVNYKAQGKPLAWIFTIARNLCNMRFRERSHMVDFGLEEMAGDELGELCLSIEQAADKMVLKEALRKLKAEERRIVLLHSAEGLKHREIAERFSLPLSTVLSKYNRAIQKLKKLLEE